MEILLLRLSEVYSMLSSIVFVLLVVSNSLWIAHLLRRLRDVKNDPSKYDKIRGYDEYVSSAWYWPPKKPFNKTDPPQTSRPRFLALFLIIPFWQFTTMELFHILVVPSDTKVFALNERLPVLIFALLSMAFGLVLAYYLTLNSKKPQDICVSIFELCKSKRRHVVWKQWTLVLLIMSVVMFPLRLWTMFNYGYIDDNTVVCKGILSGDRVFELEECAYSIIMAESGDEVTELVITNADGEILSLKNSDLDHFAEANEIIRAQVKGIQN